MCVLSLCWETDLREISEKMKRERESSEDDNDTTKKEEKFVKEYSDALLKACSQGKTQLLLRYYTQSLSFDSARQSRVRF